jgi:hypothetical protein
MLISILVFAVPYKHYAFSLSMGVFAVGLSLLVNFIKYRVGKNNSVRTGKEENFNEET